MLNVESLIDIARNSTAEQHRVAAACYDKRGRLISTGVNQPQKSHTLQAKYAEKTGLSERIYLHAEVASLVKCRCDPWTLQIVRIGPKEYAKPSAPCPICRMAAEEAGVKELVYMNQNNEWTKEEV
jgi:deoxycytidylate deaminase